MKKLFKMLGLLLGVFVLAFVLFFTYGVFTDFEPAPVEIVYEASVPVVNVADTVISITTWNIGYCGLGAKANFFYDGGDQMRCSEAEQTENMLAIRSFLQANPADVFLLQEIDMDSHRSYGVNEVDTMAAALPNYTKYFATNYKVDFVPQPLSDPMGKVYSGIVTYSKFKASRVERHNFVNEKSIPVSSYMLDYCFMAQYVPLASGDTVVIVNTHSSAFSPGELKRAQTNQLREFLVAQYAKGYHVVVGGDWNQMPSGYAPTFTNTNHPTFVTHEIDNPFIEGWQIVYDKTVPTNREVNTAYEPEKTYVSVLDFFAVSPNIDILAVKTSDLGFRNTDHHPVTIQLKLSHKKNIE
ncbi:MAG: hypothetical protein RIS47_384 [Bacteroidota bacterium]|jgi:endonuclease/exonuclease/phosphatase family metal-dependent hydrolase